MNWRSGVETDLSEVLQADGVYENVTRGNLAKKKDLLNIVTIDDAKDIGTVIVFPSFIHHQILPITKGKRESLVNWSIVKTFT